MVLCAAPGCTQQWRHLGPCDGEVLTPKRARLTKLVVERNKDAHDEPEQADASPDQADALEAQSPASWTKDTIVLLPVGLIGKVLSVHGDDVEVLELPRGTHSVLSALAHSRVLPGLAQVLVLDCVAKNTYDTVRTVRESLRALTRDGASTLAEAKRVYRATGTLPRKKMVKVLKDDAYLRRIALLQA